MQLRRFFVSGRVQGVGFRNFTRMICVSLGLTGFVKNLPNGKVEIAVEGSPSQIENFMRRISVHFSRGISVEKLETAESREIERREFASFAILA
ncbi:MAG: acylphosphatase [Candidatus Micrarchaeota archaeon]|nr:acylphosphatase [Candidatus Micrarchaeota archaeon]